MGCPCGGSLAIAGSLQLVSVTGHSILLLSQGHSWRLTGDSSATWSFVTSEITTAASVASYTNFYGHGDMDMMEVSGPMAGIATLLLAHSLHRIQIGNGGPWAVRHKR